MSELYTRRKVSALQAAAGPAPLKPPSSKQFAEAFKASQARRAAAGKLIIPTAAGFK